VSGLCTNYTAVQDFPNQGRGLPPAHPCRSVRRGAWGAGNPLPHRRRRQIHASRACSIATRSGTREAAAGSSPPSAWVFGIGLRRPASTRGLMARAAAGVGRARARMRPAVSCGVCGSLHSGEPVRLDTPHLSGRVEEAKNCANSGASEIWLRLQRGAPSGVQSGAGRTGRVDMRRARSDFRNAQNGPAAGGRRRHHGRGAEKGARSARGTVHGGVWRAASHGGGGEGSVSQGAKPRGARHRLCSNERGEAATHHGAEPVSEEKAE